MNAKLRDLAHRLGTDEQGMTTVEYAIVLCLIAVVAVGTWESFGGHIKDRLTSADSAINGSLETATTSAAQGD
ncbi:MAG: Flp family type IVb pilin [Myxococcales bacterium]|jgi:Flp pilus assembly pilin Flp